MCVSYLLDCDHCGCFFQNTLSINNSIIVSSFYFVFLCFQVYLFYWFAFSITHIRLIHTHTQMLPYNIVIILVNLFHQHLNEIYVCGSHHCHIVLREIVQFSLIVNSVHIYYKFILEYHKCRRALRSKISEKDS